MPKIDQWTTEQDLAALVRVAAINKDPARKKACCEAIAAQQAGLGKDVKPKMPGAEKGGKKDDCNKMGMPC